MVRRRRVGAMVQETAPGSLLGRMLERSRAEIAAEWRRLLADQGLPSQQRMARTEPDAIQTNFDRIIGLAIASLSAPDAEARAGARAGLLALYRQFGRSWAEADGAEPGRAAEPPRVTQAAWRVLLRRHAALSRDEWLQVVQEIDALAMDLTLSRVYGYMSYKEELLAAQQRTLASLTDELTRVETQQRRAVALELHDSLAQQLVSLLSGIQHCERLVGRDAGAAGRELVRLRRIAQDTIRDARGMIRDLHFGGTAPGGGIAALGDYVADLEADTGIRHTFRGAGAAGELGPTQEALVLRIIQEALINARKHAAPGRIDVVIEDAGDALRVSVRDDGRGFDVGEAQDRSRRRGRFGLIGMRERAQLLGATLDIISAPGRGTAVGLTVPRRGPS